MSGKGGGFSLFKTSPFGVSAKKSPASDEDSDEDFFSRSKHTYAIIASEEQERKKRKVTQAQSPDGGQELAEPGSEKRQRNDKLPNVSPSSSSHERSSPQILIPSGPPIIDTSPGGQEDPSAQVIVDLENSDSGSSPVEEIPEDRLQSPLRETALREDGSEPPSEVATSKPPVVEKPPTADPELDVVVSILITSTIPETTALKVQRRSGQRLKEARLGWCHRQDYDDAKAADIVLTWRGKQVYDSTSCYGLGIRVNAAGEVIHQGDMDIIANTDGQIHMEAVTRQMLKDLKITKSLAEAVTKRDAAPSENLSAAQPAEKRVCLILRSKDREDLKLGVKESHTIGRLVVAFRRENELSESDHISVYFDGEELDLNATVEGCEINDMDTLDVYVK